MQTVAEALRDSTISPRVREIMHLIPYARRRELEFRGTYLCPYNGAQAVILKDERHFIVCRSGSVIRCTESPSIFAALDGIGVCRHLWRE